MLNAKSLLSLVATVLVVMKFCIGLTYQPVYSSLRHFYNYLLPHGTSSSPDTIPLLVTGMILDQSQLEQLQIPKYIA